VSVVIERKPWQERCLVPSISARLGDFKRTHAYFQMDTGNRNRLRLHHEWADYQNWVAWLGFGNGNSDDVWTLGIEIVVPGWFAAQVERWHERRAARSSPAPGTDR
jgi:hypothetical protein